VHRNLVWAATPSDALPVSLSVCVPSPADRRIAHDVAVRTARMILRLRHRFRWKVERLRKRLKEVPVLGQRSICSIVPSYSLPPRIGATHFLFLVFVFLGGGGGGGGSRESGGKHLLPSFPEYTAPQVPCKPADPARASPASPSGSLQHWVPRQSSSSSRPHCAVGSALQQVKKQQVLAAAARSQLQAAGSGLRNPNFVSR
jgi:hypothetical protein